MVARHGWTRGGRDTVAHVLPCQVTVRSPQCNKNFLNRQCYQRSTGLFLQPLSTGKYLLVVHYLYSRYQWSKYSSPHPQTHASARQYTIILRGIGTFMWLGRPTPTSHTYVYHNNLYMILNTFSFKFHSIFSKIVLFLGVERYSDLLWYYFVPRLPTPLVILLNPLRNNQRQRNSMP